MLEARTRQLASGHAASSSYRAMAEPGSPKDGSLDLFIPLESDAKVPATVAHPPAFDGPAANEPPARKDGGGYRPVQQAPGAKRVGVALKTGRGSRPAAEEVDRGSWTDEVPADLTIPHTSAPVMAPPPVAASNRPAAVVPPPAPSSRPGSKDPLVPGPSRAPGPMATISAVPTPPSSRPRGSDPLVPGPSRAPAPMAVIGASARPPTADPFPTGSNRGALPTFTGPQPNRPPMPDALVPGGRPSQAPTGRGSTHDFASTVPMPPGPFVPPVAASNRPPGAQGSPGAAFAPPAGGPPGQYERAFRQWSSPSLPPQQEAAGDQVSFQVYTPEDIGRGPMRSMAAISSPPPRKTSVGLRLLGALIGIVVVALTGAAVIAVSTEEPARPRPVVAPSASAVETAATPPPAPTPTTITIGDPIDPPAGSATAPPTVTAAPIVPAPAPTPAPAPKPRVRPTATGGGGGVAPPPNPYGD